MTVNVITLPEQNGLPDDELRLLNTGWSAIVYEGLTVDVDAHPAELETVTLYAPLVADPDVAYEDNVPVDVVVVVGIPGPLHV